MPKEKTLTVNINLLLSEAQVEAIDDWSFGNRIRSRSEAIRRLIEKGLEAEKEKQ
ncbi:MAG: hypothetical protein RIC87_15490 [Kiloniellales bacterium]